MNFFSIDHLIVYTFLAATLLIGLWAGRGIKNIREYAIANKMYGTGVLTITFLATYFGGCQYYWHTSNTILLLWHCCWSYWSSHVGNCYHVSLCRSIDCTQDAALLSLHYPGRHDARTIWTAGRRHYWR